MNAWNYIVGQCTRWVAQNLSWIPAGLGNAKDWLANAAAKGYPITSTPAPGRAVVYGGGGGYSALGHVALVTAVNSNGTFEVSEMNYRGVGVVDRRVSTMADVLGFIAPPAGYVGALPSAPGAITPISLTSPAPAADPSAGIKTVADLITAGSLNTGQFLQSQVVALAVAAVVLLVLFKK
jgi:hypothetical protein